MRQITDTDLVGKKIKSIDNKAVNLVKITFEDDTTVELWAELAAIPSVGEVPCILIEDNPDPDIEYETFSVNHKNSGGCNHGHN